MDAFRWNYINSIDTPFLYSKINEGIYAKKLKTTTGFTQRTAIYTGSEGIESGMFTMFTFDAVNSPFRFLKNSLKLKYFSSENHFYERLFKFKGIRIAARLAYKQYLNKRTKLKIQIETKAKEFANNAPVAHIPLTLLPEIGVSEDNHAIYLPGALKNETIFDIFANQNIKHKYLMYPVVNGKDNDVINEILREKDSDCVILLSQFSDSDYFVHQYGPKSYKRRAITGEIDRKMREIFNAYGNNCTYIIIGDHGMTDVVKEVDIPSILRPLMIKNKVRHGVDYLVFLDSTMARFRYMTEKGEQFLSDIFTIDALNKFGRFVDKKCARVNSIPFGDRKYGDLIWWADNGILLFPDYFHDKNTHNKGMHGYDSNHDDMKGFFLAFGAGIGKRRISQADLIDVCPSICKALQIRAPRQNKGACLLD